MEEPASEDASSPSSEESGEAAAAIDEFLTRALVEARRIGRDLLELLSLGLDKTRVGLRERGFRAALLAWLALAAVTATIVAAYFVVEGLAGGLTSLFSGPAWLGRLLAGLLVLALLGSGLLAIRGRSRRRHLERLQTKYRKRRRQPAGDGGDST